MRILVAFALLLVSFSCFSAEITCFSGKTRIYHGWGHDFVYNQDFIAFTEYKTEHLVLISGDCIVMAPVYQGDKFNAIVSERPHFLV